MISREVIVIILFSFYSYFIIFFDSPVRRPPSAVRRPQTPLAARRPPFTVRRPHPHFIESRTQPVLSTFSEVFCDILLYIRTEM